MHHPWIARGHSRPFFSIREMSAVTDWELLDPDSDNEWQEVPAAREDLPCSSAAGLSVAASGRIPAAVPAAAPPSAPAAPNATVTRRSGSPAPVSYWPFGPKEPCCHPAPALFSLSTTNLMRYHVSFLGCR